MQDPLPKGSQQKGFQKPIVHCGIGIKQASKARSVLNANAMLKCTCYFNSSLSLSTGRTEPVPTGMSGLIDSQYVFSTLPVHWVNTCAYQARFPLPRVEKAYQLRSNFKAKYLLRSLPSLNILNKKMLGPLSLSHSAFASSFPFSLLLAGWAFGGFVPRRLYLASQLAAWTQN